MVASDSSKYLLIHLLFYNRLLIVYSRMTLDYAINMHLLKVLDVWTLPYGQHFWSIRPRLIA